MVVRVVPTLRDADSYRCRSMAVRDGSTVSSRVVLRRVAVNSIFFHCVTDLCACSHLGQIAVGHRIGSVSVIGYGCSCILNDRLACVQVDFRGKLGRSRSQTVLVVLVAPILRDADSRRRRRMAVRDRSVGVRRRTGYFISFRHIILGNCVRDLLAINVLRQIAPSIGPVISVFRYRRTWCRCSRW